MFVAFPVRCSAPLTKAQLAEIDRDASCEYWKPKNEMGLGEFFDFMTRVIGDRPHRPNTKYCKPVGRGIVHRFAGWRARRKHASMPSGSHPGAWAKAGK